MRDIRYKWNEGPNSVGVSNEVSLPQFKVLGHRQRAMEISLTTERDEDMTPTDVQGPKLEPQAYTSPSLCDHIDIASGKLIGSQVTTESDAELEKCTENWSVQNSHSWRERMYACKYWR
ncbi:hypothetical protein J6590_016998 [Homalodisca vitripennis]|nr:hypothetical protein J6590_016998 [Homalodisca vitripennis]